MSIKAINLDFYGTLVDWLSVWIEVSGKIVSYNNLNLSPKEFALEWRQIQRQLLDKKEFTPFKENILSALIELCNKYKIKNNNYHELLFTKWKGIKPYPEVNKVLGKLKSRFKLAICTNSSRDLFEICANKIPIKFDYIFISDETKVNKPHIRMYQIAIKSLGVAPKNILHVGSSQMDIRGATNAGLVVCWINREREKRLSETPKLKFEIHNLDDLLTTIRTFQVLL